MISGLFKKDKLILYINTGNEKIIKESDKP